MSLRRKIYEVIEVADKDDRDSLIYDRFMLVCIAASIVPLCFKETNALFIWLDRATVTVFIVDYLLRWWTADLKYEKSGKWAFLRYPFSFFGIVDLLSVLPSLTMLSSGFKLFRLFRLNKALKALKFLRYSHSFELILNVIKREKRDELVALEHQPEVVAVIFDPLGEFLFCRRFGHGKALGFHRRDRVQIVHRCCSDLHGSALSI